LLFIDGSQRGKKKKKAKKMENVVAG